MQECQCIVQVTDSREGVGFMPACSLETGRAGFELIYRGGYERTALTDGSNICTLLLAQLFLD